MPRSTMQHDLEGPLKVPISENVDPVDDKILDEC